MGYALTLGDFVLSGDGSGDGYWSAATLADGASIGSPDPVLSIVRGLLQDGSVATVESWENRSVSLRVEVAGSTSADLEAAEAALVAEVAKRNVLTWKPIDDNGHASVFDVVTSRLDYEFDDLLDAQFRRVFRLELTCEPFPRSADEQVVTAVAPTTTTPTTITVDNGSSTTGWSAAYSATLSINSGRVRATRTSSRYTTVSMTRAGAVTMTGTPYLVIRLRYPTASQSGIKFQIDGAAATIVARGPSAAEGSSYSIREFTLSVPANFTTFNVRADVGTSQFLEVDYINRTDAIPSSGTTRQRYWTLDVPGSVRGPGSLELSSPSGAGLGQVILYSSDGSADGYIPSLSSFETSTAAASRTALSSNVTGSYFNITTGADTFYVPVSTLVRGTHVLMARLWVQSGNPATQSVSWTAQVFMDPANNVGAVGPTRSGVTTITWVTTGNYELFTLGALDLPIMDLPDTSGAAVRIQITTGGLTANTLRLDEAWAFNLDVGDLTVVDLGTQLPSPGISGSMLWTLPPSTSRPYPQLLAGTAADGSDAYNPGTDAVSVAVHTFTPPQMQVFTVTSNSLDATVRWRGYPRWYHHAAE